ncbi:Oxidoreductase, molybdopterin-binding domain-containing protein [Trichoderma barbatum]
MVRHWAVHGANIVIGDVADAAGEELVASLRTAYPKGIFEFRHCDVTDWDSQVSLFDAATKASPHGSIDIVVPNAGIILPGEATKFENPDLVNGKLLEPNTATLDVNVKGVIFTSHLALYYLPQNKRSDRCLLFVGSVASLIALPGQSHYCMSKHAVLGLFRSMRGTASLKGIRMNMIAPYYIAQTKMLQASTEALLLSGSAGPGQVPDVVDAATRLIADESIVGRALVIGPRLKPHDFEDIDKGSGLTDDENENQTQGIWECYAHDYDQPPNEWKIEQGLDPAHLGLRNQMTNSTELRVGANDDPAFVVKEERKGWKDYVEWEEYPEKKARARKRFSQHTFPPPPEFQLGPIPATNPVLEGSWKTVLEEKHPGMLHLRQFPYNGEPPKGLLSKEAITPNDLHFVRNHGGIPDIDPVEFDLRLDGLVNDPKILTLDDLKNEALFPQTSMLIGEYAGEGDEMINAPWAEGAIGTAKWSGVSLKMIIKYCGGLKGDAKHIELYGAETYFKGGDCMNYVVSVPWSKVKANEVLLAWEMNGKPLPKIHGFPLRAVVMGYIGARSVKWLYRVKAIENSSRAPVQSREYLYFQQQYRKHNQLPTYTFANITTVGIQIQEMPVSSAIMSPWHKEVVVHNGHIEVTGWAYSGGGRWPERVEVSSDGGWAWYAVPIENLSPKHKYAWRTWSASVPCDHEGWTELVVRCWDNSLNTQRMNRQCKPT